MSGMDPAANDNTGPQPPASGQFPEIPGSAPADSAGGQAPAVPAAPVPPAQPAVSLPLPPVPGAAAVQNAPAIPPDRPDPAKNDVSDTTPLADPHVVDDGDLIEKEWVHKAKQIVDRNRNDPYKQSEELTVFRADYMKKRYNKNIKLDE